ncbi:PREDICTED: protein STAY-GREEN, chloroplastic-like isoform X2 [Lupinus angustifolius]|uniref:protein STAY-GREEN, chloroplastic-like isoform X2 n=1 Tax=Lupinus angustifolius TaxID=3871 RepID=UPI00092F1AC3|nr:PREDICTED: protein STAY-GREEN, chloroplastic-like isoform X2 [Lupinus angustifolius]
MGTLTTTVPVLPSKLNKPSLSLQQLSPFPHRRRLNKKNQTIVPVARLFGPAIFEASKLKVLFLGVDDNKHPGKLPRTYTLTHSDITSKLTLAISQTINNSQVLRAFVHGDGNLFNNYPELEEALVWVHFHSNIQEFNKVECWGPLKEASAPSSSESRSSKEGNSSMQSTPTSSNEDFEDLAMPQSCKEACECCFPPMRLSSIPWSWSWSEEVHSHPYDQQVPNVGSQQRQNL